MQAFRLARWRIDGAPMDATFLVTTHHLSRNNLRGPAYPCAWLGVAMFGSVIVGLVVIIAAVLVAGFIMSKLID